VCAALAVTLADGDQKTTGVLVQGAPATCPVLECDPRQSISESLSVSEPVTTAKNAASEIEDEALARI
jgi:hypothetical protein